MLKDVGMEVPKVKKQGTICAAKQGMMACNNYTCMRVNGCVSAILHREFTDSRSLIYHCKNRFASGCGYIPQLHYILLQLSA